jgi:hypothetical protein
MYNVSPQVDGAPDVTQSKVWRQEAFHEEAFHEEAFHEEAFHEEAFHEVSQDEPQEVNVYTLSIWYAM